MSGVAGPAPGPPGGPWFALLESNTTGTGRQFVQRARAQGLRPVLLTADPGRYPYAAADDVDVRLLDSADPVAVRRVCADLAHPAGPGLSGVTSSSEYFVARAARAAADLGLPAPDPERIAGARSKEQQRRTLAAAGEPGPEFTAAGDVAAAVAAAESIGYPVVLKPVTGSGSVGVRLCRDATETAAWAAELLSRTGDERGAAVPARLLVEAFLVGPEFSVETFDGEVAAVVAKHLGPAPYFVETGHDVPAPVPAGTADALAAAARRAVRALGLTWGAAHTELRFTGRGPVVVEVNPRLAGGMIPDAVRAALGVDLVGAVVARVAGRPVPRPVPAAGHAAVRFAVATRPGKVLAVRGLAAASAGNGVVSVTVTAPAGRDVTITHSFQDRLAAVVGSGADSATAARTATQALGQIGFDLDPGPDPEPATDPEPSMQPAVHEGVRGR